MHLLKWRHDPSLPKLKVYNYPTRLIYDRISPKSKYEKGGLFAYMIFFCKNVGINLFSVLQKTSVILWYSLHGVLVNAQ